MYIYSVMCEGCFGGMVVHKFGRMLALVLCQKFRGGLPLPWLVSFARKEILTLKNFHVRNECFGFLVR